MIPIDGEKLIEEIDFHLGDYPTTWGHGFNKAMEYVKKWIGSGKFNLPPGTLIIRREEGYELRECEDCIVMYCSCVDIDDTRKDMRPRSKEPCKYHVTESELKAAYIVGGEE